MNTQIDNPVSIIPSSKFLAVMTEQIEPQLKSCMTSGYLPLAAAVSHSASTAGHPEATRGLYYEIYKPGKAVGVVVISHGFTETIEKYKEMIFYMLKQNYMVCLADHRGHGRSLRESSHPNRIHINHFTDYVEDLHAFVTQIVKPQAKELPFYLLGHSMGGGIAALYLETYPNDFQKTVLSSPMLRINLGAFPETAGLLIAGFMKLIGRGDTFGITQHDFIPGEQFIDSASSCEERFLYYHNKREATPLFQAGGSSYSWIYEAIHTCRKIRSKNSCAKIQTPILLFECITDAFVDKRGIAALCANTKNVTLIRMPDCKHEIYNSADNVILDYYTKIFQFWRY